MMTVFEPEFDTTITTNPHHQDHIQDLNQQEERNSYQIQVQKTVIITINGQEYIPLRKEN